jgi:NitT/TauT family transport system substrate-binding protein
VLALGASVIAARAIPARAQALPTLRLGVIPTDAYAEALYAQDLGYFQRAGLNVELQMFTAGSAASAAIIGGQLDISVTTPLLLAEAMLRGVPFVIVASGSTNTQRAPGMLLCVAKDGPIRSARDLEGKTVALNTLRTLLHLALIAYLTKNNVDPAKVQTTEMTFSQMAAAIERGNIQAATLSEPFLAAALKGGSVRVLADPMAAVAPTFVQAAWFCTAPYAQRNP